MPAPIVFFDIAGPDLKQQSAFYSAVFGWEISPDGRFSVSVQYPLHGLLRSDPIEKLLYPAVDDVTAVLTKVVANGGSIDTPRFEVPGVVVLGLFRDPAGNRMGLVERTATTTPSPIVFFDIASPDVKKQSAFYSEVFGWEIAPDGRFIVIVKSPLHGLLRQDPSDKLLYMGVDDVTATLNKIVASGGSIDAPRFEVPGVVVLGLFRDPAGNRMGLVEMDGDKAKVP